MMSQTFVSRLAHAVLEVRVKRLAALCTTCPLPVPILSQRAHLGLMSSAIRDAILTHHLACR